MKGLKQAEMLLKKEEQVIFSLRAIFEQFGYRKFKMSKFEEYDFYAENRSFLNSENILTFTGLDGKLLALKPDVTLSIVKNTRGSREAAERVYYNENVYRARPLYRKDGGRRQVLYDRHRSEYCAQQKLGGGRLQRKPQHRRVGVRRSGKLERALAGGDRAGRSGMYLGAGLHL